MGPNVQRSSFGASRLSLGKVLILAALVPLLGTLYVAFPSFLNFNRVGLLKDTCWAETVVHPVLLWHPFPRKTLISGSGIQTLVKEALRHIATTPIHWIDAISPDLSVDDDILNRTVRHRSQSTHDLLASSSPSFDIIILDQAASLDIIQLAAARLAAGGVLALSLPNSWEHTLAQTLAIFKHVHLFTPYDSIGRTSYYAVATNSDALPPPTHLSVSHINTLIGRRIVYKSSLQYYDGEIHLRIFLLQRHIREKLRDLYNKSNRPVSSPPNFSPFPYDENTATAVYPKAVTLTRDLVQCEKLPSSEQDAIDILVQSLKSAEATGSRRPASYSWSTYQNITYSVPPGLDPAAIMSGPELDTSRPVGTSAPAHLAVTAIYDGGSVSLHILPHLEFARASVTNLNGWVSPEEILNSLADFLHATRSSGSVMTGPPPLIDSSRLDERLSHLGDGQIGSLDYWRLSYPYWTSPKVGLYRSPIAGTGNWATEDILEGEVVFRSFVELNLAHVDEYKNYPLWKQRYVHHFGEQAHDEIYFATPRKGEDYVSYYTNHACSPNIRYNDTYDYFIAIRNISAGEEVTFDYSTSSLDFEFGCHCGSNTCRHVVSGADWQNEELVARLGKEAFWPFLKAKILRREREKSRKH